MRRIGNSCASTKHCHPVCMHGINELWAYWIHPINIPHFRHVFCMVLLFSILLKKIYFKYLIALDALKVDSFLHKHNLFLIGANLVCFLFIVHRKMVLSNNNIGNIPESEDGCSLLGSSRKSLADTSVTSTADLSVFSIGQRSQQYDICADDMQSVHSDGEGGGESSPG